MSKYDNCSKGIRCNQCIEMKMCWYEDMKEKHPEWLKIN